MGRILEVVALQVFIELELHATAGNGAVLGVGLDALYESLECLCREFQRVFLVSQYER